MKNSILIAMVAFFTMAFQCQRTYVDHSFVTMKGVLVDATGQPLVDQQLIFGQTQGMDPGYGLDLTIEEVNPLRIRAIRTNQDGSFRIIHPDKTAYFVIYDRESTQFHFLGDSGTLVKKNYLYFNRGKVDTKNVFDFGIVKLIEP
ncbi:hypothetical protein [Rhodonellum sp.]|uniref:hypothetical protein n=1 Tax=Rhodonellum sp. TaxID=2231180 RepID=UPI002716DEB7|nr:hypothetical protein [Rhodonellum sp.]MDO9553435.1 hypothetical protein [Rhodonellum sp.]